MSGKPKLDSLLGLSMNEAKLILLANYLAGDQPKVDYEKLALLGGYKTGDSAAVMYRNAKKKLTQFKPGNGFSVTPDGTPASTPKKTPTKRKKVEGDGGVPGTPDDEQESPSKRRPRKSPVKKEASAQALKNESDDEGGKGGVKLEDEMFPGVKAEVDDDF